MWPMVQSGPMVSGKPRSVWQTQPSCTFEPVADHDRLVVAAQHRVEPDRGARLAGPPGPISRAPGATQKSPSAGSSGATPSSA